MEKLLKNELFRSFILSIVIFAVLMIGTATSVINSYWQGVLILCGINIILAVSLNLAAGYLGQLTLGHAGFMSVGAYTSALLSIYLNLPFIVSLLIGAIAAGVIGLIIGIPVLRLKGDYLCIITLAFNEIIRVVMNNLEITNGAKGLIGIPLNTNLVYVFIAMIITIFVVYSIAIISIREDETASELSGIDVGYYKVFAFAVSAIFAGLAGGLYAHYYTVILPKGFDFNKSVEILVMVVLGGMGNLKGSIIAAIVLTIIPELLISFSQYRMLLYAIVLIAAMILKGTGKGEQIMERLPFFKKKDEVKPE